MNKVVRSCVVSFAVAAVLALALSPAASVSISAAAEQGAERGAAERAAQDEAFRRGGYPAAAKVTGSYVRTVTNREQAQFASLQELVAASDLIVVGRVAGNKGVLTPRGDSIRTHYRVQIESVLKWSERGKRPTSIVVSVIGGRASLSGGEVIEEQITSFVRPATGEKVVLMLNQIPLQAVPAGVDTSEAEYWPALQRHGIFVIAEEAVLPSDVRRLSSGSPTMQYRRAPLARFLADIRAEIGKANGRSK